MEILSRVVLIHNKESVFDKEVINYINGRVFKSLRSQLDYINMIRGLYERNISFTVDDLKGDEKNPVIGLKNKD